MPVIYLDLDGTLTDVWRRYDAVMRSFFESLQVPFLSIEEYKRLKWLCVQDEAIIRHVVKDHSHAIEDILEHYRLWKRERLESESLLERDAPIGRLHEFAGRLQPAYRLNLISVRRNHEFAMRQLRRWGMIDTFERIDLVLPSPSGNPKREAMKGRAGRDDLIVGDSETDVECGSLLGLRTYHVQTGLRSFEYAATYGPATKLKQYDEILSYL